VLSKKSSRDQHKDYLQEFVHDHGFHAVICALMNLIDQSIEPEGIGYPLAERCGGREFIDLCYQLDVAKANRRL